MTSKIPHIIVIEGEDSSDFIVDFITTFIVVKNDLDIDFFCITAIKDEESNINYIFEIDDKEHFIHQDRFPILAMPAKNVNDFVLFTKSKISSELKRFIGNLKTQYPKHFNANLTIKAVKNLDIFDSKYVNTSQNQKLTSKETIIFQKPNKKSINDTSTQFSSSSSEELKNVNLIKEMLKAKKKSSSEENSIPIQQEDFDIFVDPNSTKEELSVKKLEKPKTKKTTAKTQTFEPKHGEFKFNKDKIQNSISIDEDEIKKKLDAIKEQEEKLRSESLDVFPANSVSDD